MHMGAQGGRIVIRTADGKERALSLPAQGVVRVGSHAQCPVCVAGDGVRPVHFQLKCTPKGVGLVALENCPLGVNGAAGSSRVLQDGDTVTFGSASLRFLAAGGSASTAKGATPTRPAAASAGSPAGSPGGSPAGSPRGARVSGSAKGSLSGQKMGGYLVEGLIGKGGMGTVYKARQLSLDRPVALKILGASMTKDRKFVESFLNEARAAAKLNHPNVVQIYDAANEGNVYFFSMEYLPGGSLGEILKRQSRLPLERALQVARDAAEALVWAEDRGIVHRDIKPDNLLLAADGTVKVADLGIAVEQSGGEPDNGNKAAGSPRFMAPEQITGEPVDHRSDQYALGSTLFRAIAGVPPFDGSVKEILNAKLQESPPLLRDVLPGIPTFVGEMVARTMARQPEGRFPSSVAFVDAIDDCLQRLHEPKSAAPPAALPKKTSSPVPLYGGIAVAALVILAAVYWAIQRPSDPPPPDRPPIEVAGSGGDGSRESEAEHSSSQESNTDAPPAGTPESGASVPDAGSPETGRPPVLTRRDDERRIALLRELRDTYAEFSAGITDGERTLSRLQAFKKNHPEPVFQKSVDQFIENVQRALAEQHQELIASTIEEKIDPLIEAGDFVTASQRLETLLERLPDSKGSVDEARTRLGAAIATALESRRESVLTAIADGKLPSAASDFEAFVGTVPEALRGDAEQVLAAVKKVATANEAVAKQLDRAFLGVREAISKGQFDAAGKLVDELPESLTFPGGAKGTLADAANQRYGKQRTELANEVGVCEVAWKRLLGGVGTAIREGSDFSVLFSGDDDKYRIREIEGANILVQKGRDRETRSLLRLSAASLWKLTAAAGGEDDESKLREGLGIVLLYASGPASAKEFLLDDRLEVSKRERYQQRLREEERAYLGRVVRVATETATNLAGNSELSEKELAQQWAALSRYVRSEVAANKRASSYAKHRVALADLYLQAKVEALRAKLPDSLFRGAKVASYDEKKNSIALQYRFKDSPDLSDFVEVLPASSRIEATAKTAKIIGEFRFTDGNPFRNSLTIEALIPAGGFSEAAPNINFALWTHSGDKVTPRYSRRTEDRGSLISSSNFEDALEWGTDDYFVFGLGYKGKTSNWTDSTYNFLRIHGLGGRRIPMPANVVFGGQRGFPLHWNTGAEAIWGTGVVSKVRGAQKFSVSMSPSELRWKIRDRPIKLQESGDLERFRRDEPYVGSFTVFTNGSVVHISQLRIEGELNPEWINTRLRSLAESDYRKVEPKYPFKAKTTRNTSTPPRPQ